MEPVLVSKRGGQGVSKSLRLVIWHKSVFLRAILGGVGLGMLNWALKRLDAGEAALWSGLGLSQRRRRSWVDPPM